MGMRGEGTGGGRGRICSREDSRPTQDTNLAFGVHSVKSTVVCKALACTSVQLCSRHKQPLQAEHCGKPMFGILSRLGIASCALPTGRSHVEPFQHLLTVRFLVAARSRRTWRQGTCKCCTGKTPSCQILTRAMPTQQAGPLLCESFPQP